MRSAKSSGEPEHGYIGRFAPSPSGALHFGSLLAALASYLDARAHSGQWLVRMEDLDPAREPPGAADQILRTLEAFGLFWDGQVIYQSQRQAAYFEALEQLQHQSLT
ncbi:MAG TPA: tRNA glutamyl-Q(34) synthetase GluQRS, partial [Pseudohongiella sp.]|nr:tRNA glutamyl-Q(34) synthetase GluQRS [Pseudohongiella sp.]